MSDSYSLACQRENMSIKAWREPLVVWTRRTRHSHTLWVEGSLVKVPLRTIWKCLFKKHMACDPIISPLETFTMDILGKLYQDVLIRILIASYKNQNNLHAYQQASMWINYGKFMFLIIQEFSKNKAGVYSDMESFPRCYIMRQNEGKDNVYTAIFIIVHSIHKRIY